MEGEVSGMNKRSKIYANIVMTNHPELKGFGEIFEKILNNINKKE